MVPVIGCDGLNSKTRSLMFGAHAPRPTYTHKFAYRGLVATTEVRALLGNDKATGRYMHMGAGAHILSCPVAGGRMVNVAAFVTDTNPWGGKDGRLVGSGSKSGAIQDFADFGPSARGLISLLPEKLDKWAIFDMFDDPLPTFVQGRLCLAGDAAHASAPHHGAGAGYGVEDSLALAELLTAIDGRRLSTPVKTVIPKILAVYNEMRYSRCQALVESSRTVGEMYEWQHEPTRTDAEAFARELYLRCHRIWDYDVDKMVHRGLEAIFPLLS
jgi:salicylate hydroxylase